MTGTGASLSYLISGVASRRVKGRVGTGFIAIPHAGKMIQLLHVKADDLTACLFIKKDTFTGHVSNETRPSRLPNTANANANNWATGLPSYSTASKSLAEVPNRRTRGIYFSFWTEYEGFPSAEYISVLADEVSAVETR